MAAARGKLEISSEFKGNLDPNTKRYLSTTEIVTISVDSTNALLAASELAQCVQNVKPTSENITSIIVVIKLKTPSAMTREDCTKEHFLGLIKGALEGAEKNCDVEKVVLNIDTPPEPHIRVNQFLLCASLDAADDLAKYSKLYFDPIIIDSVFSEFITEDEANNLMNLIAQKKMTAVDYRGALEEIQYPHLRIKHREQYKFGWAAGVSREVLNEISINIQQHRKSIQGRYQKFALVVANNTNIRRVIYLDEYESPSYHPHLAKIFQDYPRLQLKAASNGFFNQWKLTLADCQQFGVHNPILSYGIYFFDLKDAIRKKQIAPADGELQCHIPEDCSQEEIRNSISAINENTSVTCLKMSCYGLKAETLQTLASQTLRYFGISFYGEFSSTAVFQFDYRSLIITHPYLRELCIDRHRFIEQTLALNLLEMLRTNRTLTKLALRTVLDEPGDVNTALRNLMTNNTTLTHVEVWVATDRQYVDLPLMKIDIRNGRDTHIAYDYQIYLKLKPHITKERELRQHISQQISMDESVALGFLRANKGHAFRYSIFGKNGGPVLPIIRAFAKPEASDELKVPSNEVADAFRERLVRFSDTRFAQQCLTMSGF